MVIRETLPLYEGLRRNRVARERDGDRHTQPIVPYYGTPVRLLQSCFGIMGSKTANLGNFCSTSRFFPVSLLQRIETLGLSRFREKFVMLGLSSHPRTKLTRGELERRLRLLEQAVERRSGRISASATDTADQLGETIASALSSTADRFRRGARSVGNEAEKVRGQAADLGKDVLQRLSHEVEHRPLVILAVAIGVGILIGLASNRR